MALGICNAVEMTTTLKQLGSKCFRMIQPPLAPVDLAANTYSCSFKDKICPRIYRAILTQYSSAKIRNKEMILAPRSSKTVPWIKGPSTVFSTDASKITISISGRE